MQSVIRIENLVKRYQEVVALDHLNLEVKEGEIFGLLGPNGSGKTTAIGCMLALLSFDKGSVKVFGTEIQPDSYEIKRNIGVVLQNVAVFDELTADKRFQLEANQITQTKFIVVKPVTNPESASVLKRATGLDQGESEAIVLTDELKASLVY